MMSQCLCRCVMYLVRVSLLLKFTEGFTAAWSPSILQKSILELFCKTTCLIVQNVH
jgi:hypothetical protein